MQDWLAAILLGVIEGITEFLPISSTGHLLLVGHWLKLPESSFLRSDIFVVGIQSGAVIAVIAVFSERVKQLATRFTEPATRDYLLKLGAAFVLTAVGVLLLKKAGMKIPKEVAPIAWATLVGGVLFLVLEHWLKDKPSVSEITWTVALAIGAGQLVAAAFPGASRSGTTILAALALGLSRPAATEFSFLLGVPTPCRRRLRDDEGDEERPGRASGLARAGSRHAGLGGHRLPCRALVAALHSDAHVRRVRLVSRRGGRDDSAVRSVTRSSAREEPDQLRTERSLRRPLAHRVTAATNRKSLPGGATVQHAQVRSRLDELSARLGQRLVACAGQFVFPTHEQAAREERAQLVDDLRRQLNWSVSAPLRLAIFAD